MDVCPSISEWARVFGVRNNSPEHVIESRQHHIEERLRVLERQPADWPYRKATEAEIELCKQEIAKAEIARTANTLSAA